MECRKRQLFLFLLFLFQLLISITCSLLLFWNNEELVFRSVKGNCSKNENENITNHGDAENNLTDSDKTSIVPSIKSAVLQTVNVKKNRSSLLHSQNVAMKSTQNGSINDKFNIASKISNQSSGNQTTFVETGRLKVSTSNKPNATHFEDFKSHFLVCPDPLGRLGNWMFEFAASLGIAKTLNYKYVIKQSHNLLRYFDTKQEVVSKNVANVMAIRETQWKNVAWRNNRIYFSHNLTLLGHFQSWKYFENLSSEVRKAFTIKPQFLTQAMKFLKENTLGVKTLIGIHVRRGDFVTKYSVKQGRVVADKFYINRAMEFFRKKYENAFFVVVSDDKKWCKDNFKGNDVLFSQFREPILDMAIMSLSDHAIITAGSFSWWGGWLSNGTVVYLKDFPRPGSSLDGPLFVREEYYLPAWIGMGNGPANTTILKTI